MSPRVVCVVTFCLVLFAGLIRFVLATLCAYPRTVTYTLGSDLASMIGNLVMALWIALVLWR